MISNRADPNIQLRETLKKLCLIIWFTYWWWIVSTPELTIRKRTVIAVDGRLCTWTIFSMSWKDSHLYTTWAKWLRILKIRFPRNSKKNCLRARMKAGILGFLRWNPREKMGCKNSPRKGLLHFPTSRLGRNTASHTWEWVRVFSGYSFKLFILSHGCISPWRGGILHFFFWMTSVLVLIVKVYN